MTIPVPHRVGGLLLALLGTAGLAPAQVSLYGSGCSGVAPEPGISYSGSTTPKKNGVVHLTGGLPNSVAVLIVGVSDTQLAGGAPLPLDLSGITGMQPGCQLWSSTEVLLVLPTDALGEIDFGFKLPSGLGEDLNFQWAVVEQEDPLSLTMTQAVHLDLTKVVTPSAPALDFGFLPYGTGPATLPLTLTNDTAKPVTIDGAVIYDAGASDFGVSFVEPLPVTLDPGEDTLADVSFDPMSAGLTGATLEIQHADLPAGFTEPTVDLSGVGLGPPGAELLVNAGGGTYFDSQFQMWSADVGAIGGTALTTRNPITNTDDPELFQSFREDPSFSYAFDVPNGLYEVTLRFAEVQWLIPDRRIFDISVEGALVVDDLDLIVAAGAAGVAHEETITTTVEDGTLGLFLVASEDEAIVQGIEVRSLFPVATPTPATLDFGPVTVGETGSLPLAIANDGTADLQIDAVTLLNDGEQGGSEAFTLDLEGTSYAGSGTEEVLPVDPPLVLAPGAQTAATSIAFDPTVHEPYGATLQLDGNFGSLAVPLSGFGARVGETLLHVVIEDVGVPVDYDDDGSEPVLLDGQFSHTHEPNQEIVAWEWTEGETTLSTAVTDLVPLAVGPHTVCLEIFDDKVPAESLQDCVDLEVYMKTAVPGVVARYYQPTGGDSATDLLDAVPTNADFAETLDEMRVEDTGVIGGSPFSENVMVQLDGIFDAPAADTYAFAVAGGTDTRLEVDGAPVAGPLALAAGPHDVEARVAVLQITELPIEVTVDQGGGGAMPIAPEDLTHDLTDELPVIGSMPTEGITLGGNEIVIQGFGFFPYDQVTVHWGATDLVLADFDSIGATSIRFDSPPHPEGVIAVTVETPQGVSNARSFEYGIATTPPIDFVQLDPMPVSGTGSLTCGDWGPDGRFYVLERFGRLRAITFDDDYGMVDMQVYDGVNGLSNNEALGIAFNPFDEYSPNSGPVEEVKVYVAHAELFAQGGGSFAGPAPYPGQVSVLTGPDFDAPVPLITGLPTSNHDHGVNGMAFDNNGDLLICIGGNTNAGVASLPMGTLPESPLSAAIVKAETSRPDFDGAVTYERTSDGMPSDDQVEGEDVDQVSGHVGVHASGLRNAYDLVYTTARRVYATDNGPNTGFGPWSTGPDTEGGQPSTPDEVMLIEAGNYYGHPNRARGRYDERQNVYHWSFEDSIPGVFTGALTEVSSSTDGIVEYRATTFQEQMRGQILVQRWNGAVTRFELSEDGRSIESSSDVTNLQTLDVQVGPGGAILGVDYSSKGVEVLVPNDVSATGMRAFDIFPWRATPGGGQPFVIGGVNFGTLGDTSVTIGGLAATVTSVSAQRIVGELPANSSPTADLVDVVVDSDSQVATITDGFRYLFATPGNEPGFWEDGAAMPNALAEVGGGIVDGVLYLVGDAGNATLAYDIEAQTWDSGLAQRPFKGDHHAAEVVDGKLYLFGGLTSGAPGTVQIYDPAGDSWSLGATMPWPAGSVSTALIDGLVYVCGGIVGSSTVSDHYAYDPVADSWSAALAPMPVGRNHAAHGTDGERLFVFGGRTGGNVVANGFDDVQVYDPLTDTWEWDKDVGSPLAPMPFPRGGMGRAIFWQGEFYVFGGETDDDPGADPNGVFDRVDVYDPVANTWREEAPMPTARHGIYPLLYQGRVFVAGGGDQAGFNPVTTLEIFTRQ